MTITRKVLLGLVLMMLHHSAFGSVEEEENNAIAMLRGGAPPEERVLTEKVQAQCAVVILGPIPCRAADKKAGSKLEKSVKQAIDEELAKDTSTSTVLEMEDVDISRAWVESPLKCDQKDTLDTMRRRELLKIPAGVFGCIMAATGVSGTCRQRNRDRRDLAGCTLDNSDQRRLSDAPRRRMNEQENEILERALQSEDMNIAEKLYNSKKLLKTDFFSEIDCVCVTCGSAKYFHPKKYTDSWEDQDGLTMQKTYKCKKLCERKWIEKELRLADPTV
mmetsp:Transcript_1784/g.4292  ORF Transcript_1784/g.4292 Transcript_1784/m.4292 type:complete len:276 (-) Transcript_1784:96-923(-)|eukprot:CAMPEP_0116841512 /NCGR_PEP_ID=MMETSP0418-20121206/10974_1 /TAXON_ID=1158023 /ORGANISM="Astrosyne radiata, Strain 13vi08-1A" /LENGTH=275 /DNA_ID=CAMNT_0004471963 /DNA_START=27 /DNA_END=854 /DNA_ORIENTATION=+